MENVMTTTKSLQYLVKGRSIKTGEDVIGFPYIYLGTTENGAVGYCNVILTPPELNKPIGSDGVNAINISVNEMHPIDGPIYRFSHMDNGKAVFEDESAEAKLAVAATLSVDTDPKDKIDAGTPEGAIKLFGMKKFIEGAKWAADNGITSNMITKNEKPDKV